MLSEARHSTQSPTDSVQTGSVRTGPISGAKGRTSRQSSITEEEESRRVPPAPPLPATLRTPVKSSPVSPSPSSSTSTTTSSSTHTESTKKSKSSVRGAGVSKVLSGITLPKTTLRRVNSDEKNKYARHLPDPITKVSEPKQKMTGISSRISARDFINGKPSTTVSSQFRGGKTNQSTFEKVDTHDGHTTYLGAGTFADLESCIQDCLWHKRCDTSATHHASKHDHHYKSLTRASVLEDYSYDGVLEPKHHVSLSNHCDSHYDHHDRSDHYRHHSSNYHHYHDEHRKRAAELSLLEIREVNDALAKYGIPVFSHHHNPHLPHQQPHSVGEIVSACRLLLEEPRLAGLHRDGTHAVQHAWDAMHHSPTMHNNQHGYASPAMQSVVSHLFHPNQTPYDPVHGVASHLFGTPQYPPPAPHPPPPSNPGQSAISHLFGPPQNPGGPSFNNSYPQYPPPAPPPPSSSGQSVLSRLFGSPQNSAGPQYSGNNQHIY